MGKLLTSIAIGIIAGGIDIVPMILQKLDKFSISSAFIQWLVVSFIICHIQLPLQGWLKGMLLALVMALPVMVLVLQNDAKSVAPIMIMSAILGSLVGLASERLVR